MGLMKKIKAEKATIDAKNASKTQEKEPKKAEKAPRKGPRSVLSLELSRGRAKLKIGDYEFGLGIEKDEAV